MGAKPRVREVIVVEGRYDKNTLSQVVEATIIELGGFGIYSNRQKLNLLRRLGQERGLIILTDSDGAGFQLRSFLKGAISPELIRNAYIPDRPGREKRKSSPSREGKLGVEGMSPEVLIEALARAGATMDGGALPTSAAITRGDLYDLGLSGGQNSGKKRAALLKKLDLPEGLTAKGLIEVLNLLYTREELALAASLLDEDGAEGGQED